ncbi:MAG: hypothetical protein LDL31_08410, partial [Prosthecobacter sp.]|nr:hypothetical protein [Prosthecobacter sp.]
TISLPKGQAHYVEDLVTGRRYEVDTAMSSGTRLAIDSGSMPSVSNRITLRPHWTLEALLPSGLFTAATHADQADRVMIFDPASGNFRTASCHADGWTGDFDGSQIVPPGTGLLVQVRQGSVTHTLTGAVRATPFHMPLLQGPQLVSSGFLKDHSPYSLGLNPDNGFITAPSASNAARLRLWRGDLTPGTEGYQGYFLRSSPAGSQWVDEADPAALDQTRAVLIQPGQAFFLLPTTELPDFQEK